MKQHASRRVIPEPVHFEEEFDSDEFFSNEPMVPEPPESDDEIGSGYEFSRNESSLKPSALRLLRIDPAVASGVLVTTFTDCSGFLSFLGLATLFLRFLQPE